MGDTNLYFTVDEHSFVANISVSAINEFLMGSDWLAQDGVKWNFAESTISLGDKVIYAYQCVLNKVCRRVFVSEDCVVPPKYEANVLVKMQDDGIPHPPSDWALNPCKLELGVVAARTLFSDSHGVTVACVCNYSTKLYMF